MKTKKTQPNFKVSRFESEIINRIADRAVLLAREAGVKYDKLSAQMDLSACHNSCPLDLTKLEAAPAADFGHDVFGIRRYMDRSTGNLTDCFTPRCAMPANHKTVETE